MTKVAVLEALQGPTHFEDADGHQLVVIDRSWGVVHNGMSMGCRVAMLTPDVNVGYANEIAFEVYDDE